MNHTRNRKPAMWQLILFGTIGLAGLFTPAIMCPPVDKQDNGYYPGFEPTESEDMWPPQPDAE